MDHVPQRLKIASVYRIILNNFEGHISFLIKNPSYYQVIGLGLSVFYLFSASILTDFCTITAILIFDWLDGAAARRYHLEGRRGWMIDVLVDRLSEGFIFFKYLFNPVGIAAFIAYLLNIILSFYSIKTGRHLLLPLRFILAMLLILKIWVG